ncbi:hypothetical protein HMPREF1550_00274 [Actinomyces sp. oral taxon 877 str. F0543]|nr:hypothetical protein HMPREF1550_00274 [Actinomyces sp. oral taxon 877 str. F0543]
MFPPAGLVRPPRDQRGETVPCASRRKWSVKPIDTRSPQC